MAESPSLDLGSLLAALTTARVDFVVVGGVACLLHGAPTTTLDLDIVHRIADDNLGRLERALADLGALVRDPAGRDIRPTRAHLEAGGQLKLTTRLGPLDLLSSLRDGRAFEDLLALTVEMEEGGQTIRVVDLPTLIEIKRTTGRVHDRLIVPLLLALQGLEE